MELMKFICPDSPYVWNQDGVSQCFDNLVLGFGSNVITVALTAVLWIHNGCKERKSNFSPKVHLILAVLGILLSIVDMFMLLHEKLEGQSILLHKWLNSCSQVVMWVIFAILLSTKTWLPVLSNCIMCCWWIIRILLLVPRLQLIFASIEVVTWTIEICAAVNSLVFGFTIFATRMKKTPHGKRGFTTFVASKSQAHYNLRHLLYYSSIMEPLLPYQGEHENCCVRNVGILNSIFHHMTFKVINPLMQRGVKKQLDFQDLLQLTEDMDPSSCHETILRTWNSQKTDNHIHPSLFKAICFAYGWPYFWIGLLKVTNDCLSFAGPLLLNKLIHFLQKGSRSNDGYILAISLGLVSVLKSFLDTQYSFWLAQLRLKMRSSIMTMIYRKCLLVSLAERSKFSEGEIQTFMSVDADRIVNLCNSIHDVWSLPLQIGLALYLLYQQVKFAFVSGLAITILLIPVNKWIANLIAKATNIMMEKKDERIRMSSELLNHIRTLKMYGWEPLFARWLMKTRSSEVDYLSEVFGRLVCVFWATTPTLFSLFTFGLHTLLGHQLDAATVFTCLSLFNNLISPLNSFPWVINGLIDASISVRRVGNYLSCYESDDISEFVSSSPTIHYENPEIIESSVVISNASCTWASYDAEYDLILKDISLQVQKGLMVVVVGEVGSGKSCLLNMILGETRLVHGSTFVSGSKSYVPQVPWIMSGTIRDNILLGNAFDSKRYTEALHSCCLDFDISLMVKGDMTCIGEKGINLSGGQRARLALSRAIYHNSDMYLLDDVLSAVDAHVARSILHNAILGPLMNQKTRILCTHNTQAISLADMVIEMDKGNVKYVGSSVNLPATYVTEIYTFTEPKADTSSNAPCQSNEVQEIAFLDNSFNDSEEIVEVESRKEGKVELIVYKKYAAFGGWFITIVICVSAIMMQASRNGNDVWLSFWVDTTRRGESKYSISFFLVILCVFCVTNATLTLIRAFSFAFGGLRAAVEVHEKLLHSIIDAPLSFFNQTPTGRILNRLSSDLYTIDDSLPFILNILLANFVGLLGITIVLSFVQATFLLLLIPFWFYYRKLQLYYRSTSRELRRLDSVSRSPIYTSFTETLDGSSTIRAFNSVDVFFRKFMQHVHVYQRTSYSEIVASLWLSLRLQLLAAFIISFVAVMAIVGTHGYMPISLGTSGLVGLALSYASPIVSLLGSFLSSFAETEKEMISIERVLQYMDIPQEVLTGENPLSLNWPSEGEIKFHNVTLYYTPSSPPSLFDLSFCISGGSRVGIVGRTGAGKSSILNVLFRLNPINSGCILVDGLDIARIPVRDLRSRLAIVPQSPFLFEGSLRTNLDPLETCNDEKIWDALEQCCLKEEVQVSGGLDIQVKEAGVPFSVGQRQLLCLARALLKSSKVLCLDECTANVDTQTASKLDKAISGEHEGRTIITIAHRISTVLSMGNIFVLDQGMLVEQGNPQVLLKDESSRFSKLAQASVISH